MNQQILLPGLPRVVSQRGFGSLGRNLFDKF